MLLIVASITRKSPDHLKRWREREGVQDGGWSSLGWIAASEQLVFFLAPPRARQRSQSPSLADLGYIRWDYDAHRSAPEKAPRERRSGRRLLLFFCSCLSAVGLSLWLCLTVSHSVSVSFQKVELFLVLSKNRWPRRTEERERAGRSIQVSAGGCVQERTNSLAPPIPTRIKTCAAPLSSPLIYPSETIQKRKAHNLKIVNRSPYTHTVSLRHQAHCNQPLRERSATCPPLSTQHAFRCYERSE